MRIFFMRVTSLTIALFSHTSSAQISNGAPCGGTCTVSVGGDNNGIFAGSNLNILGETPFNNVLIGGFSNTIDQTGNNANGASCAILAGQSNTIDSAAGSVISGGFENSINGNAVTSGGEQGARLSFLGGGFKNQIAATHAAVPGAGQFNSVSGDFAMALGSFAQAEHPGSIVVSARNTPGNIQSGVDRPEHHCSSQGDNTVHICSGNASGVFVNEINLIAELQSKLSQTAASAEFETLQSQITVLQTDSFNLQLQVGLNQVISNATLQALKTVQEQIEANQNLTEELESVKAQLAALTLAFAQIDSACFVSGSGGTRRLDTKPCAVAPAVIEEPPDIVVIISASVGGTLLLVAGAFLLYSNRKPKVIRPKPVQGDYELQIFPRERNQARSSTPMSPPQYPPPVESGERPPTPPPRVRRGEEEQQGTASSRSFSSSSLYEKGVKLFGSGFWYKARSSQGNYRSEDIERKSKEDRGRTPQVFGQRQNRENSYDDEEKDEEREAIF